MRRWRTTLKPLLSSRRAIGPLTMRWQRQGENYHENVPEGFPPNRRWRPRRWTEAHKGRFRGPLTISVDASRERCFVPPRATIDFERRYVGVGRGYA